MLARVLRSLCVGAFAVAMLVATMAPSSALFDKTRFVAHLGVAYFAFHHWVLHPYQEGAFANDAPHRTTAITKAGLALLFAVHEVRVSEKIAADSNDPLLQKVHAATTNLGDTFASIGEKFKGGNFQSSDMASLAGSTGALAGLANAAGMTIKDTPVAIPGT